MLRRFKPFASFLKMPSIRAMIEVRDKNRWLPESLEDVRAHMERHNPDFACIYFHASWNPFMKKINAEFEKVCIEHPEIMHIWVDSDKHPTIKFYYDAKVEPTFVLLINGGEVARVVGDDFERVVQLYKKMVSLHYSEFEYLGSAKRVYEPFEAHSLKLKRWIEISKDPMNLYVDKAQ